MEKTICELFAGVGGFRLGLEKQSKEWKTVWFSQWEPNKKNQWAHDCYVKHWGDIDKNTGIDIAKVDKKDIPKHNLLVGGFPCQDYSVAHHNAKGIEGKKGVLWWDIYNILQEHKTPFCLFENVDRLLKSPSKQKGKDFGIILSCLAKLDYNVEWRVINAADYGLTQKRKRTFIFAYKNNTKYSKTQFTYSPNEIITKNGFFAKVFPIQQIETQLNTINLDFEDIVQISQTFKYDFNNSGYMKNGVIYTIDTIPIYENPIPLKQLLESNVDEKYYIKDIEKWQDAKSSKQIERTSKEGYKYIYRAGTMPFPDNIDLPARTMITSESSLCRCSHVVKDPSNGRLRILTPIEAERIQGFDDNWTNTGMPEKYRYFCMGNALVVPLITKMGVELSDIFNKEID